MQILYILALLPTYRETVLSFLAHRSLPVGDQPQPPTTSGATCTQTKLCLRCMDARVSTNVPAWLMNRFYLMVRMRGIKCVHLPDLFLSDGSIEGGIKYVHLLSTHPT